MDAVYSFLNGKTFVKKNEGSRMLVYECKSHPAIVLKIVAPAQHLANKFSSWGIPLDRQDWAPIQGNALASAETLLKKSIESFYLARQRLEGLAAPFTILDGRKDETPVGSVKLCDSNGIESQKDFRNMVALVQQKIRTFEEFIPAFMQAKRGNDLENIFSSLIELTKNLWRRGLFFEVLNFNNDYGIDHNNRVLISDIGELSTDKEKAAEYFRRSKMLDEYAYKWLQNSYPELSKHYKDLAEQQLTVASLNKAWGTEKSCSEMEVAFDTRAMQLNDDT